VPCERLGEDFAGPWRSELFPDVSILVDGKEFPAVFAARSTAFFEIFENQKKNKEGDESKAILKITGIIICDITLTINMLDSKKRLNGF